MGNKFFLTREAASHSGPERFHFATNLNRTLTIEEGRELRDLLTEMLGDAPESLPSAADLDAVSAEEEVKEETQPKPFGA